MIKDMSELVQGQTLSGHVQWSDHIRLRKEGMPF